MRHDDGVDPHGNPATLHSRVSIGDEIDGVVCTIPPLAHDAIGTGAANVAKPGQSDGQPRDGMGHPILGQPVDRARYRPVPHVRDRGATGRPRKSGDQAQSGTGCRACSRRKHRARHQGSCGRRSMRRCLPGSRTQRWPCRQDKPRARPSLPPASHHPPSDRTSDHQEASHWFPTLRGECNLSPAKPASRAMARISFVMRRTGRVRRAVITDSVSAARKSWSVVACGNDVAGPGQSSRWPRGRWPRAARRTASNPRRS